MSDNLSVSVDSHSAVLVPRFRANRAAGGDRISAALALAGPQSVRAVAAVCRAQNHTVDTHVRRIRAKLRLTPEDESRLSAVCQRGYRSKCVAAVVAQ
jgi:hypothetical protein